MKRKRREHEKLQKTSYAMHRERRIED